MAEPNSNESLQDYYSVYQQIGNGGYGTVHLGRCLETGMPRAIKTIKKARRSRYEDIEIEITVHERADHPNIVETYDIFETRDEVHIVMEILCNGNLFEWRNSGAYAGERDLVSIVQGILKGLDYLHHQGITHRDLKLENVMISEEEPLEVKLIDFGLSHVSTVEAGEVSMSEKVGTSTYMAPELHRHEEYTNKVDMWGLGVICYLLVTGEFPFNNTSEPMEELVNWTAPHFTEPYWQQYSATLKSFVSSLLNRDPVKRPNALACMCHPWLQQFAVSGNHEGLHFRGNSHLSRGIQTGDTAKKSWLRAYHAVCALNRMSKLVQ